MFSKLNLNFIVITLLVGASVYFFTSWQFRGKEMERNKSNYENKLLEKDEVFTEYQFQKTKELEEALENTEQLKGLSQKLDSFGIKLRKVERIVSTRVIIQDSTLNKVVLDSISAVLSKLQANSDGEVVYPIVDETDCFKIEARVVFSDGTITHEIINRQAVDTLNYITSFKRKKHHWLFGIPTGLFGKKIYQVDLFNNCGFSKTIVID